MDGTTESEYILKHNVHKVVNAMLTDMLRDRPNSILDYFATWCKTGSPKSVSGGAGTVPLEFFCADICPFAQRVWIALEEKHVPFQYREVNFTNHKLPSTLEFHKVAPSKAVPAIRLPDGTCMEDSLPLLMWLDAAYPNPPLTPTADPHAVYQMHKLLKRVPDWTKAYYDILKAQPDTLEDKSKAFTAVLDELSQQLQNTQGPYLLGSQYSLIDIAFWTIMERSTHTLGHFEKYDLLSHPQWALISRWMQAVAVRPAVAATLWQRRSSASYAIQGIPEECDARSDYIRYYYKTYASGQPAAGKALLGGTKPPHMPQEEWNSLGIS